MDQAQRLDILIERFAAESHRFGVPGPGAADEDKRIALRSMMNLRMPLPMDADTLRIQDEYLALRAQERGIVTLSDIPTLGGRFGVSAPLGAVLSLWQGDITRLAVGAIVNAANSQMLGCFVPMHACIDNCIHTYAGIELRAACEAYMAEKRRRFGRDYEQPTAEPMLTPAFNLPSDYVVHIVGPIVGDRVRPDQIEELAACYRNTLALCAEQKIRSVAFCAISTGVFRFPKEPAAEIAVRTVTRWLRENPGLFERVIFTVHGDANRRIYENLFTETDILRD